MGKSNSQGAGNVSGSAPSPQNPGGKNDVLVAVAPASIWDYLEGIENPLYR